MSEPDQESVLLKFRNLSLDLSSPKIMGILNTTPDSFSDGGEYLSPALALKRIGQMISEGANIIDVGGESTRPGADSVSEDEEIRRVIPILKRAIQDFQNVIFSVDTTKYGVAKAALNAGAHIINDVSGLNKEPGLAELCGETGAGYILMHSQGDPKTMQMNPEYDNIIDDLNLFFESKIALLKNSGVDSIVIDPGIGFGKTPEHNLAIVAELSEFKSFGCPILVGASRKSMIGELLDGRPVTGRLAGTLALHYQCLINGANMLRVHDVQEAADSIKIYKAVHQKS